MLTLTLRHATHHTLTAGLISTGDVWIQMKSWCKVLADEYEDSVDTEDTAGGDDI
jgi:hypothetical protein